MVLIVLMAKEGKVLQSDMVNLHKRKYANVVDKASQLRTESKCVQTYMR